MDVERAAKELPSLGPKLWEVMRESIHVVTSLHPDAKRVGRMLLRQYNESKGSPGIVPDVVTVRFRAPTGEEIVKESRPFEPNALEYLSEAPGEGRYDSDRTKLLQTLESTGSRVDGLIVVPDYPVYCDITKLFKGQEFRGSGRHKIPALDEAIATLFDLRERKISYL
jgi:hypothetical protein